jgi:hypothetical protein
MNRRRVFSGFSKILSEDDVVFCIGKAIISESKFDSFGGVCYFDDLSVDYFAIALGMSMGLKKRVFLFCEDSYFIRYINTMVQISVSGCTNFYVIILNTGIYTNDLKTPSLAKSIRSIKGTLFNMGVLVHDYSIYFDNAQGVNKLKAILNKSLGPLVALIKIDNKRLYGNDIKISNDLDSLRLFISEKPSEGTG